jgi:hypothetical protein
LLDRGLRQTDVGELELIGVALGTFTARVHAATDKRIATHAPTDDINVIPLPVPADQIKRRKVLAGLINEYEQAA